MRSGRTVLRRGAALLGASVGSGLVVLGGLSGLAGAAGSPIANVYQSTQAQKAASFAAVIKVSSTNGPATSATIHFSGSVDFTNNNLSGTLNIPGSGRVRVVEVGGIEYVSVPAADRSKVPGHKPWISVNLNKTTGGALSGQSSSNPTELLQLLESGSASVKKVGTATVRGAKTTHYHAVLDLSKAAQTNPQAASEIEKATAELHTKTLPVDVWVDAKSRARRFVTGFTVPAGTSLGNGQTASTPTHVKVSMDLFKYGSAPSVTTPPASEVYANTKSG